MNLLYEAGVGRYGVFDFSCSAVPIGRTAILPSSIKHRQF
jgi:hypothetical protein